MRRIAIWLDGTLEQAIEEAPARLGIDVDATDAEKLRAYILLGYERTLQDDLDRARLATYRVWADEPEMGSVAKAAARRAAARGLHDDV